MYEKRTLYYRVPQEVKSRKGRRSWWSVLMLEAKSLTTKDTKDHEGIRLWVSGPFVVRKRARSHCSWPSSDPTAFARSRTSSVCLNSGESFGVFSTRRSH